MHRINLEKYDIRCDLIDDINGFSINKNKKIINNIKIEKVRINKKIARKINKEEGTYVSIIFDDITDNVSSNNLKQVLISELKELLNEKGLLGKSSLVVGLGNNLSTPDSLGPKVIDNIISTRHLYELSEVDKNYSCVSKITPGVFATTGIESLDIIQGIVRKIKPDFIIVIDALCSTSIKKINKVIQITDSGITPGSGVENHRKELSKNKLGVDTIIIGVPTVVNLHTIVREFLIDYEIEDILKEKGNNYLVTPKDIDFEIEKISFIISDSINKVLHNMTN